MGIYEVELGSAPETDILALSVKEKGLGIIKKSQSEEFISIFFDSYDDLINFLVNVRAFYFSLKKEYPGFSDLNLSPEKAFLKFRTSVYKKFIQPFIDLQSDSSDFSEEKDPDARVRNLTEEIEALKASLREKEEELAEIEKYQAGMQIL